MNKSEQKWNSIYQKRAEAGPPSDFLVAHQYLLPTQGKALDLACGLGANADFLQQKGLETEAWDISPVALAQLNQRRPAITTHVRDLETKPPSANNFDVIVVADFLHRPLCPYISEALRPDGLLFYRTFVQEKVSEKGPSNPEFLLKNNELLTLFKGLRILFYEEASRHGDISLGERNHASLIATKAAL